MLLHNLHTRGHEHSRTKRAQLAFSLGQWQYKVENSGSRAFRLKSVAIRRLDFARDMQGAPKNTGPSRTLGRHRKWDWEWCTIQTSNVTQPFSEQLCHCRGRSIYPSPLHSVWSAALWGMGLGPPQISKRIKKSSKGNSTRSKELPELAGQAMTMLNQKVPAFVHAPPPHGIAVVVTAVPVQSLLL